MARSLAILILATSVAFAGTPPKRPAPDIFGNGYLGIYPTGEESLTVRELTADGSARAAGLLMGDRILSAGEFEPKNFTELRNFIVEQRPGTKVPMTVLRGETKMTIRITLGARPDNTNGYQPPINIDD